MTGKRERASEPLPLSTCLAVVTIIDPREEFYHNFQRDKGMDLKEQYLASHRSLLDELGDGKIADLGVVDSKEGVYQAVRKSVEWESDGVIINLPGWAPPGWGGLVYSGTGLPILINAPFALSGPLAMRGELEALGADYLISLGRDGKLDEFINRVKARKLLGSLHGKRYANVGGLSMDMHYAEIASSEALREFGVETVYLDGSGVLSRSERINPRRTASFMTRLEESVASPYPDDSGMLARQISHYLALKDMLEEEGVDFASLKCQPEFSDEYGSLCFAQVFMPLAEDLEGQKKVIPLSCEGDFFASLAGYLLFTLTGETPLFADFIIPLYEDNLLALQNCGGAPACYAGGEGISGCLGNARIVPNLQGKSGSFCLDYMGQEMDRVTLVGMGKRHSSYWLSFQGGSIQRREEFKPLLMDWPTFFLRVEDVRGCLDKFYSQHLVLVPGDHQPVLQELQKLVEAGN